jgi:hypothetical protein
VMYEVREQTAGHDRVEVMISTYYLLLWLVPTVVEWFTCFRTF